MEKVALGSFGAADDLAPIAVFLADDAGYVTGPAIGIDGGSTMF